MEGVHGAPSRFRDGVNASAYPKLPGLTEVRAYWLGVGFVSFLAAIALVLVFRESPVPPGGDPGNWIATSLAYLGAPYPSQLYPLAYPPVVFPLLGAATLIAGGPLAGVDLFAGALMVAFGLSVGALAATLLRSRVVALAVVAFVLLDPAVLAMFFWGAYPNLLGFVFMHLAFVGLLRAGRGHTSTGGAQFWGFFALATLSHSLVGLTLALTAALFLTFGLFVPLQDRGAIVDQARKGTLEAPGVAIRALFASRGGRGGLVVFLLLVGGYYGFTYAAGIPHPYYLASNPVGFRLISLAGAFQALLPNVVVQPSLVLGTLIVGVLAALALFALVRDRHPAWLTSPVLLLLVWPLAVSLMFIGGDLAQIVTDYHRFGFFYILPAALILAYVVERAWVLRPRATSTAMSPGRVDAPPTAPSIPSPRAWPDPRGRFALDPAKARPLAFGVVSVAILLVVVDTATVPALARDEASFTRLGHDQAFLDAVGAIRSSGTHGGILTVAGADKWARGLTGENTYAPYSTDAYLFYPSQQVDSQLAYYALRSHYALTNGLVAGAVRALDPTQSDGVPVYSVYVLGTPRETLRIAPSDLHVVLHSTSNGSTYVVGLTTEPTVVLPTTLEGPMEIRFVEPSFWLTIAVAVVGYTPEVTIDLSAGASAPHSVVEIDAAVTPPTGSSALAWSSSVPGTFFWTVVGALRRPVTYGNVTPVTALNGATDYDASTGGPAALLAFRAPTTNGSAAVSGQLALTTPAAVSYMQGLPGVLSAPAIWQSLGIRFVLMRNESIGPNPYLSFAGEVPYLEQEYGLPLVFENSEWSVLVVPAATGTSTVLGGAG